MADGGSADIASLRAALEGAIGEDHVELHAPNLVGVPVLIRVGAADNTVPPWWSRRAWRLLLAAGGNATLTELDRKEHWWWDTHTENDGGVMNDGDVPKDKHKTLGGALKSVFRRKK